MSDILISLRSVQIILKSSHERLKYPIRDHWCRSSDISRHLGYSLLKSSRLSPCQCIRLGCVHCCLRPYTKSKLCSYESDDIDLQGFCVNITCSESSQFWNSNNNLITGRNSDFQDKAKSSQNKTTQKVESKKKLKNLSVVTSKTFQNDLGRTWRYK